MASAREDMTAGKLYRADAPDLVAEAGAAEAWLHRYNTAGPIGADARRALLAERMAEVGQGVVVRAPFHCDYGFNIRLGDGVFLNFGCVVLDIAPVTIGEGTQIGPAVQIYAADHPRDPEQRRQGWEFGRPVTIGRNVWIGGGAILTPGITIGDDAIVGAGAVVTRDVPQGATAVGNPARVRS